MDREKFEGLIIDYLDDNLSGSEKEEFEKALGNSEEYAELVEHYRSIRSISKADEELSPSREVIEGISERVRDSVGDEKRSFAGSWLRIPIFAPAIAAVIIAMLWFTAGEDYLTNKGTIPGPDKSARQEISADYKAKAGKLNMQNAAMEKKKDEPEVINGRDAAGEPESPSSVSSVVTEYEVEKKAKAEYLSSSIKPGDSANDQFQAAREQKYGHKRKNMEAGTEVDGYLSDKEGNFTDEETVLHKTDRVSEDYTESVNTSSKTVLKETELSKNEQPEQQEKTRALAYNKPLSPAEKVEVMDGYRNELNEIVTLQYSGNCKASIERSQKLLDANPQPPPSIKTDLYVTQGDCYTELKQYDMALEVYNKAKELTPHKSYFFNTKIQEVYIKQAK